MDSKVKPPKAKKRNSEKRKEKSRDAARYRRSQETEIFKDMASLLPLPDSTVASLDKASIMRLAISFLRTKNILDMVPLPVQPENKLVSIADALFLKALDGFLLVISMDGDLVFLSENVHEHLGLSQIDLMGQSIYEVTHPCDHNEVKNVLSTKDLRDQKSIFIRLKCTLSSKGRNVNVKTAAYKVIHCTGHLVQNEILPNSNLKKVDANDTNNNTSKSSSNSKQNAKENIENKENKKNGSDDEDGDDRIVTKCSESTVCFVAIGEPIPHPANYEIPLSRHTFLTKHSLNMKFTYADETMEDFLGFKPEIFISRSVFDYHHAQDSFHVQQSFKNLFAKGQCQTDRYRFLAFGGGYIWVVTQATLIYNKSQKAQSVVCVNFVISEIEHPKEIFSLCQLPKESLATNKSNKPIGNQSCAVQSSPVSCAETPVVIARQPTSPVVIAGQPTSNTSTLFVPKTSICEPSVTTSSVFARKPIDSESASLVSSNATVPSKPLVIPQELALDIKPLTAPLEEILPLPEGVTIPKLHYPTPPARTVQEVSTPQNLTPPKSNLNEAAEKFLSAQLQQDNPLIRALVADNHAIAQAVRPQAATDKIFAPRTEEMNKPYLTFADDDTGLTILKGEPEDLTHLAPTAGDVCVPLDTHDSLMNQLLEEFIIPDAYGPFLSESCENSSKQMSPTHSYYSYGDDRSLSPCLPYSPSGSSVPSLSSIEDSPPVIEDTSMSSLLGLEEFIDSSEDLTVRAPYIPMSVCDDLPLLMAGDLMWGSHSAIKPVCQDHNNIHSDTKNSWSKSNSPHLIQTPLPSNHKTKMSSSNNSTNSSLAKLLKSESNNNRNHFDGGGGGGGGGGGDNISQLVRSYKYSTKKGGGSTVLEFKKGSKRCATPPEWDHRGYWKRSKAPNAAQHNHHQIPKHSNSVLMNLLVSGCDVSAGYVCLTTKNNSQVSAAAATTASCASSKYY